MVGYAQITNFAASLPARSNHCTGIFPPGNKAEFPTFLVFNDNLECRVI